MEKYCVAYRESESRECLGDRVRSMQVIVDGRELYAEADPEHLDEVTIERALRAEIIRQAIMAGMAYEQLAFEPLIDKIS